MTSKKDYIEELNYNISPEELNRDFSRVYGRTISNINVLTDNVLSIISNERNVKMFKERIHYGLTYSEIGRRHGITGARARDILLNFTRVLHKVDSYGGLAPYGVSQTYNDASRVYSVLKDYRLHDLCRTNWSKVLPRRVSGAFRREFGINTFGELVSHFAEKGEDYRLYYLEGDRSIDMPKVSDLGASSLKTLTRVMFDVFISVEVMRKLVGKEDN